MQTTNKTKKIKDLPAHERPREKLLEKGAEALSDQELLAIILGKGSQNNDVLSLSKQLVKTIDEKGIKVKAKDILDVDGIGEAKATTIAAAFEFVRRRIKPEGLKIQFPVDVLPLIQHYGDRKQEHFICVSVNGANEVMSVRVVTIGLVNQSQVHPREIFADVITERASAVIVAHNHPSGVLKPSNEDIAVTKRIKEAAAILGISLLDHIIFSAKGYYSFVENNEL
jgi:DNA repair protein RadC